MADTPKKPRSGSGSGRGPNKSAPAKSGAKRAAAGKAGSKNKRGKKQVGGFRRWSVRLLQGTTIVVLLALILGVGGAAIGYARTDMPDPNEEFQANTSFVNFRDGTKMGSFASQNRQSIPYEEMPDSLKNAAVAAENRSFWEDGGISPLGMIRALWTIANGGELQSGSTITQQYIKVMYLSSERTFERKIKELFIAVKMGREVPKNEVLEGYLNTIYFGRGAYGAQAAAKSFFDVDAKDLTVPQAAYLAAALNNPASYDPSKPENLERITARYHYVLDGMVEMETLTPQQRQEYDELPEFPEIPLNERYAGPQGHLLSMVESELRAHGLTDEQINGGGLEITTTFDPRLQDQVVRSAEEQAQEAASMSGEDLAELHPAVASIDNATGEVLALYGGPDYIQDQRNWATTPRPAASAFKPFALAAGLRDGFSLYDTFQGNTFTPPGDPVEVRNQSGEQYGTVNLIEAMAQSVNTAFVDMTSQMEDGPEKIATAAEEAGAPRLDAWDTATSRFSLGIAEVSPLHMASSYATFANEGRRVPPHVIQEVKDSEGNVLIDADEQGEQTLPADLSADVTYSLQSVVDGGTGAAVSELGRPVAGKTGTHGVEDEIQSAWFVATTKQISTSVMYVAGDNGTGDLDPYKAPGDTTFYGSSYPAETWLDFMEVATEGMPEEDFAEPQFINQNSNRTSQQPSGDDDDADGSESDSQDDSSEDQPAEPAPEPTDQAEPSRPPEEAEPEEPEPRPEEGATRDDGSGGDGGSGGEGDAGEGGSGDGGSGQDDSGSGDSDSGDGGSGSGDGGSGSGDGGSGDGGSGSGDSGSGGSGSGDSGSGSGSGNSGSSREGRGSGDGSDSGSSGANSTGAPGILALHPIG